VATTADKNPSFDDFGLAEAGSPDVRTLCSDYYEGFELPDNAGLPRCGVEGRLYDAPCGPAGSKEEIVKHFLLRYALGRRKRRVGRRPHCLDFGLPTVNWRDRPAAAGHFQESASE